MPNPAWVKGGPSPNPAGRPKGLRGGRYKALAMLDKLMGQVENLEKLREALQAKFDKDPCAFFRTYVMPLIPKEAHLRLAEQDSMMPVEIRFVDCRDEEGANGQQLLDHRPVGVRRELRV